MPPRESARNSAGRAAAFNTGVDLSAIGGPDAMGQYQDTSLKANRERLGITGKALSDISGLTGVGRVANSIAGMVGDVATGSPVGTTHRVGSLGVQNSYDVAQPDGSVQHHYGQAALDALPIYGGTVLRGVARGAGAVFRAAGRGVGKAIGEVPLSPYEKPGKTLSDEEMLVNARKSMTYPKSDYADLVGGENLSLANSASKKAKAALAAGLTANPASASAIADVATVPRSLSSRVTRELGAGPKTNVNVSGRQFTFNAPQAVRTLSESQQAELKGFSEMQAAARAARAEARDAARSSALTGTGTAAGAVTSGTATVASTRAEDLAPTTHNVTNPFENSKTSETSETNNPKEKPAAKEKPTKLKPLLLGDGEFGGQDVRLRRIN